MGAARVLAPAVMTRSAVTTTVPVWGIAVALTMSVQFLGRPPLDVVMSGAFFGVLARTSLIDLRERRIPNRYTVWGLITALSIAWLLGPDVGLAAILGAALAGGVMGAAHLIGGDRLGMGDVKLSAFTGAVLGLPGVPLFLMLGSAIGCFVGLVVYLRTRNRRATFAYGPCLSLGAALVVLFRGAVSG